jgi:integrase
VPRKKKLPIPGDPEVVREGNAQVTIYGSPVKNRPRYVVAYRGLDGKRKTKSFADYSKAKEDSGDIGILTVDEMEKLLKGASERLIPLLAIGGFAGLRTAEIFRLDWDAVDFKQNHIEIKSGKAKTAQRRLAPLLPNLKAWLQPYRNSTGLVCPTREIEGERRKLAKKLGIGWPNNALRHGFASYRLSKLGSAEKVATEMGNTRTVVFQNYRKVVTKAEALEWFKIRPS